ncbi:MAG: GNAT family N-acetyltransferase [Pyrinomonadaceae bacterium]|nr:GNAT family N-acetyltransferase [Pyrinomonadaceae bacterium]
MKNADIVGRRIVLRPPKIRDLEEFVALNRASVRLHRNLVSPPKHAEEFVAYLKTCRQAGSVCFLIHQVEERAIIGSINLSQISRGGFQSAYLGYFMGELYSEQGYMTEAMQLMLRYAFEHLRLHRIEANVQPENTASLALVKRAGFVREGYSRRYLKVCGRWRDHERWAILAEDWRQLTSNI